MSLHFCRRRAGRAGFLVPAAVVLIAGGCGRREAPRLERLVDLLRGEDVVVSPLIARPAGPPGLAAVPLLADRGSGPNPFGLKRRLALGNADLTALAAVPGTELRFRLNLPPSAALSFTFGIARDEAVSQGRVARRPVTFRVLVVPRGGGAGKIVFDERLVLRPDQPLAFGHGRIDLSAYVGRGGGLHLVTEGDPDALAFWFHPVVYGRKSAARNLVLISLDTLRADHLGCYGYGRPTSPAIDALAADGTLFVSASAPSPWTLPSHMSLMTGLTVSSHGVSDGDLTLSPDVPTLAERLKPGGRFAAAVTGGLYVSGAFGFHRGFDSYRIESSLGSADEAEVIGKEACRIIEENRDRGFFLFVHTYQIHSPFYSPDEFSTTFAAKGRTPRRLAFEDLRFSLEHRFQAVPGEEREDFIALYDAEIRYTDEALVRRVVETLKAQGLYERTMIVLVGDHGEEFFEHGGWAHTHQVFEELLRVPLIIKPAGRAPAGRRVMQRASLTDVPPSVLDALGIDFQAGEFDGRSLMPWVTGRTAPGPDDRPVYGELPARPRETRLPARSAVIQGRFKLILSDAYDAEDLAYFDPDPPAAGRLALFDLKEDPNESSNLAGARPDLVRDLLRWLTTLNRTPAGPKPGRPGRLIIDGDFQERLRSLGYLIPRE